MVGIRHLLFKTKGDCLTIKTEQLAAEYEPVLLFALGRFITLAVECQCHTVRKKISFFIVKTGFDCYTFNFLVDRLRLIEADYLIVGGDTRIAVEHFHVNLAYVTRLLDIDMEHRHDNLLKHRPAMNKSASGALLAYSVQSFCSLDHHARFKPNFVAFPCINGVAGLQAFAYYKAARISQRFSHYSEIGEIRFVKLFVLIYISVVGSDQHMIAVGIAHFLYHLHYMLNFLIGSLEHFPLGDLVIAGLVYDIAIDVNQVVILEKGLRLRSIQKILGCHRNAFGKSVCKHLLA